MKKTLLVLASFISPACLLAQITLNSANAPTLTVCQTNDTVDVNKVSPLPSLTPATNATWDMTIAVDSDLIYIPNGVAANPAFSTATFTGARVYPFASGLVYAFNSMCRITAGGIEAIGEEMPRQPISIAALTGDTKDSLVFLKQDVVYSAPKLLIKYPVTANGMWTSTQKYNTAFTLTVTAYGLNATPGERRTNYTTKDTVVGWGKMRVRMPNGDTSSYMDVLQVRSESNVKDSFYLGGNPAPAQLLAAFNVSQGQVSSSYKVNFLRAGDLKPLVELECTNTSYNVYTEVNVHKQRLQKKPAGINGPEQSRMTVYPNPVTGRSFTVKTDGGNMQVARYELYSFGGQKLTEGALPGSGQVQLPASVTPGLYQFRLITKDNAVTSQILNVLN